MAKMRTITETFKEIKKNDPNTALSLCGLRRMVQTGIIPSVQIGRKRIINIDILTEYLNNVPYEKLQNTETGVIRKVC